MDLAPVHEYSSAYAQRMAEEGSSAAGTRVHRGGAVTSLEDAMNHGLARSGANMQLQPDRSNVLTRLGLRNGQSLSTKNLAIRTGEALGYVNNRLDFQEARALYHEDRLNVHEEAIRYGIGAVSDLAAGLKSVHELSEARIEQCHDRIDALGTGLNAVAGAVNATNYRVQGLEHQAATMDRRVEGIENGALLIAKRLRDDEIQIAQAFDNQGRAILDNHEAIGELREDSAARHREVKRELEAHTEGMLRLEGTLTSADERLTEDIKHNEQMLLNDRDAITVKMQDLANKLRVTELSVDDVRDRTGSLEAELFAQRAAHAAHALQSATVQAALEARIQAQDELIATLRNRIDLLIDVERDRR